MNKRHYKKFLNTSSLPLIFKLLDYDNVSLENKNLNIKVSKSKYGTLLKHIPNYKLNSRIFTYDIK